MTGPLVNSMLSVIDIVESLAQKIELQVSGISIFISSVETKIFWKCKSLIQLDPLFYLT